MHSVQWSHAGESNSRFKLSVTRFLMVALLLFSSSPRTFAISLGSAIGKIAKVADDVPIRHVDDVISNKSTLQAAQDIVRRTSGHVDDLADSKALSRIIRQTLKNVDPAILKQIDQLDVPAKQAALVMGRGAENVSQAIPDIALRSSFINEAGAETLISIGRYDDLMEDAIRFDAVAKAGRIKNGEAAAALGDFGNFFYRNGDRAHAFWTKTVRPNWKVFATGTALTAIMVAPDEYLDAAGDLTEEGIRKLGKAGASLVGGAIRGSGVAVKSVVEETSKSVYETYLKSLSGWISLIIIVFVALFLVPPARRIVIPKIYKQFRNHSESSSTTQGK